MLQILQGKTTEVGEFPFSVLLGYRSRVYRGMLPGGKRHYRDEFSWICSGVILNSRFILTAAHCRLRGRRMVVRVGVHKIPSYYNEQFSSLRGRSSSEDFYLDQESFILHEDFIKERTSKGQLRLKNDIALIKLDKDFPKPFNQSAGETLGLKTILPHQLLLAGARPTLIRSLRSMESTRVIN